MAIASFGFVLKLSDIPGGSIPFILGFGFACILTFVQSFLCVKLEGSDGFRFLGVLFSFWLTMGCMNLIFRYQWWPGWYELAIFTIALFFVCIGLLLYKWNELLNSENRGFIISNLLLPAAFIVVIGIVPVVLSKKSFYERFYKSKKGRTYEEFRTGK